MLWFTSDLHFGHEAVIRYANRPFTDLATMHEALITNWNQRVKPDDTIYVVGDLALCRFSDFEPLAQRLQGRKFLIQGNHDHYSLAQYGRVGFTVLQEAKLKLAGRMVRLSHYPWALPWWKRPFAYKSELRFMELRPPRVPGEILMHGHTHQRYRTTQDGRLHIGVDAWDYRPVSAREIESLLSQMGKG